MTCPQSPDDVQQAGERGLKLVFGAFGFSETFARILNDLFGGSSDLRPIKVDWFRRPLAPS
jgi:hypothetical protein